MKKTLRKQSLIIALLILVLLSAGCARDEYETEQEPACGPRIEEEDYQAPARALLGFGRGAIAAARLYGEFPERFQLLAGLGGPISLQGLFVQVESLLKNFDTWPELPERSERLALIEDLFRAFGNPIYYNIESGYYPPGAEYADFSDPANFTPKTINGIIDRLNPDGSIPVVTFADPSGLPVSFALALDQNGNGLRDNGEPLILQLHEDFTDTNGNGRQDEGEPFDDFGLDGVDGTFDYGEANGKFDLSPNAERFFEADVLQSVPELDPEQDWNFQGSLYFDLGTENPWGFEPGNQMLFDSLSTLTDGSIDRHCIENSAAVYDAFFWTDVYPGVRPFVPERFVWMQYPGADDSDLDPYNEIDEPDRARRILQALFFLSSRSPNWNIYKEGLDGDVVYEERSFLSVGGAQVHYAVGLPSGYYETRSQWKTYPVVYVLPDAGYDTGDWRDLLTYQGWLERKQYSQQMILVILDPDGGTFGNAGYSYFTGPADPRPGEASADDIFEEIFERVEARYRVRLE